MASEYVKYVFHRNIMETKVQAIAKRFAAYVVGAMLERSGAEFFFGRARLAGNADFLVRNRGRLMAIHADHAADAKGASKRWDEWHESMGRNRTAHARYKKTDRAADGFYDHRLVIVTGSGESVFADDATAPLLAPDYRTSLFIMAAHPAPPLESSSPHR